MITTASETIDGEVLRLRSTGRAFARISRDLGLSRSVDAQRAFQRAMLRLPATEQVLVRKQESDRLDRLATRVKADAGDSLEDQARRLAAIERLRAVLAADESAPTEPDPAVV